MAIITICRILASCLLLTQAETPYELYSIGSQLELEGHIFEAIQYYEKARAMRPESPEVHIALATAYYKTRQFDQGIRVATEGLKLFPDNVDLYNTAGIGYIGKGDLKTAIPFYLQSLNLKPDDIEIYFGLSILYEGLNDLDKASGILLDVPDTLKSSDVYVRLGTIAGKKDDHTTALDYYHKGFSMDTTNIAALLGIGTAFDLLHIPDSSMFYYEKALVDDSLLASVGKRLIEIYSDAEEYSKLVTLARRILAIDYRDGYVRRSLGYALYQMGMLEPALMEFLISAELEPDDSYSHFHAGRIYLETGEHEAAIKEIWHAIRIDPDFVELWIYLGFIAIETNDFELADYAFTEAAYRGADMVQVYYLLGVVQEMQEQYESAYCHYHKSLTNDPENLAALEALAHLCERIGRKQESFEAFEHIIEIDSLDATALNYVGYTYADRNERLEYALELIDKALQQEPDNGYFVDSRGWVFYRMGRYEEALDELKRAAELLEDEVVYEHLGDVYIELNDTERAREAYEKGLECNPHNKTLKDKIKNLVE